MPRRYTSQEQNDVTTTMTTEETNDEETGMAAAPPELHAFASYAWKNPQDQEDVHRLVQEMRLRGLRTFRDHDALGDGDGIEATIERALARSHVYVPYLTPESLASEPVRRLEFGPAQTRHAAGELGIVPVARRLGDTREEVADAVWKALGHSLQADWTGVYGGTGKLKRAQAAEAADVALRAAALRAGPLTPLELTVATHGDSPAGAGILVDGTELFGGAGRRPGKPKDWQRFLAAICDLQRHLAANAPAKQMRVDGLCHLTAAVATGWVFRQSAGWTVTGVSRGEHAPPASGPCPELDVTVTNGPALVGGALVVQLGIVRDVEAAVTAALARGDQPRRRLRVNHTFGGDVPADRLGDLARAAAEEIKRHVDATGCARIDLYVATPAAFALHLGTHLGALPPVGLHEFDGTQYTHVLDLKA